MFLKTRITALLLFSIMLLGSLTIGASSAGSTRSMVSWMSGFNAFSVTTVLTVTDENGTTTTTETFINDGDVMIVGEKETDNIYLTDGLVPGPDYCVRYLSDHEFYEDGWYWSAEWKDERWSRMYDCSFVYSSYLQERTLNADYFDVSSDGTVVTCTAKGEATRYLANAFTAVYEKNKNGGEIEYNYVVLSVVDGDLVGAKIKATIKGEGLTTYEYDMSFADAQSFSFPSSKEYKELVTLPCDVTGAWELEQEYIISEGPQVYEYTATQDGLLAFDFSGKGYDYVKCYVKYNDVRYTQMDWYHPICGEWFFRSSLEAVAGETYYFVVDFGEDEPCEFKAYGVYPEFTGPDVNYDGYLDSLDAAWILRYEVGLLEAQICGDANHDGEIDSLDAALYLKSEAGILKNIPGYDNEVNRP